MFENNQEQCAGANSQLIQAGTVNVVNNYPLANEEQVKDICERLLNDKMQILTQEALKKVQERNNEFMKVLTGKLTKIGYIVDALSEPAAQYALLDARKVAVLSDKKSDYEVLSELLLAYFRRCTDKKIRTSIKQAIEKVADIDEDALCALTVINAVVNTQPVVGVCSEGLKVLDELFRKLMYTALPSGKKWVEHLELLQMVRLSTFSDKLKPIFDLVSERLNGYVVAGIRVDSVNYEKAVGLLHKIGFKENSLIANELLEGYVLLPFVNRTGLDSAEGITKSANGKDERFSLTVEQKNILKLVWDLYDGNPEMKKKVMDEFKAKWKEYSNLNKIQEWWDNISPGFDITSVGMVLAQTNAHRIVPSIPELLLEE